MAMEPGMLLYTPPNHDEWAAPTSLFFVEQCSEGEWIVAIPAEPDATVAVSVTTRQGRSESVEFYRTKVPEGLVSTPPRNATRFDFESRAGDGLEWSDVARRIPRDLVATSVPPTEAADEFAAMQRRLQALEARERRTPPRGPPEARRLFGPPTRGTIEADADRARRLAGAAPTLARGARSRAPAALPEPDVGAAPAGSMESRIVGALEALVTAKRRSEDPEDREGGDGPTVTTTGGRGIAKLRALSERYARAPGRRWEHVSLVASEAGSETVGAYMESCTQMRRDRLTAYLTTMFARIASAAEDGDLERVLGRCASGLIFCDQYAIDGNVQLAWQMTLEPEPAVLRRHPETPLVRAFPKQRAAKFAQLQFSQLAEPAVTEAALAATRNWKEFRDAAEKLQE